jgi:hypothetical protein
MEMLMFILLVIALAVAIAITLCRRVTARDGQPTFWTATVATLTAALAAYGLLSFVYDGLDIFTLSYWRGGKDSRLLMLCFMMGLGVVMGLLPALTVVFFYQRRHKQ